MKIGAIMTERETEQVRERLRRISAAAGDWRTREQCRVIACTVNQAGRRAQRQQQKNKPQNTHEQ